MELVNYQATQIQRISEGLNNNSFYVKRDDLLPISFGGNKARKAILFFKDLDQQKSDCVVTYGSSSSNHCRVVANMAAAKSIPCHIISPNESSYQTSNLQMIDLFGAFITRCPVSQVRSTINSKMNELREKGYNPYFIQGGGHGDIGTQAYVNAYEEIVNYEKSSGIYFDYIFHTTGTGTTQAGLVCGKVIQGDKREIIGISNARKSSAGSQVVLESVNSYLVSQGIQPTNDESIHFIDDYILDGYGSYNEEILRTIRKVLVEEGIPLDTTYTGKAFWGMKEFIKKNSIFDKKILFIHTGGTPLFFDKLEELKDD